MEMRGRCVDEPQTQQLLQANQIAKRYAAESLLDNCIMLKELKTALKTNPRAACAPGDNTSDALDCIEDFIVRNSSTSTGYVSGLAVLTLQILRGYEGKKDRSQLKFDLSRREGRILEKLDPKRFYLAQLPATKDPKESSALTTARAREQKSMQKARDEHGKRVESLGDSASPPQIAEIRARWARIKVKEFAL